MALKSGQICTQVNFEIKFLVNCEALTLKALKLHIGLISRSQHQAKHYPWRLLPIQRHGDSLKVAFNCTLLCT